MPTHGRCSSRISLSCPSIARVLLCDSFHAAIANTASTRVNAAARKFGRLSGFPSERASQQQMAANVLFRRFTSVALSLCSVRIQRRDRCRRRPPRERTVGLKLKPFRGHYAVTPIRKYPAIPFKGVWPPGLIVQITQGDFVGGEAFSAYPSRIIDQTAR